MAATDPTTPIVVPDSGKATDVPEPVVVAEAGVTTSEWKLALGYLVQLAATGTAAVGVKVGLHVPDAALGYVANFEVLAALVVASYALSRGLRKLGVK